MSRILKYQESIKKFIKNRSSIINFDDDFKEFIEGEISNSEYLVPIILLTIMNSQNKKNKVSLHGYYMAAGIELLCILYKVLENDIYYKNKLGDTKYNKYINNIIICTFSSLSQNIESIHNGLKEKVIAINTLSNKYLNNKLISLINKTDISFRSQNKKNDLTKYHFKNSNDNKRTNIRQIEKQVILENMDKSISNVCRITVVLGWLLGCGDSKQIESLEKMGQTLGILIKIANDFDHIDNESDNYILVQRDNEKIQYSNNYVLNYGIQNSFELFINTKQKFIEIALKHDIYTNSIKDIVDILEKKIDCVINQTTPDLLSNGSC